MKFRLNKRCNEKTGRLMNNYKQELKHRTQVKCFNFVFLRSQLCKNGHSLFFPWGLQLLIDKSFIMSWSSENCIYTSYLFNM